MGSWESGYQKLKVWQEARASVTIIYELTSCFPQSERFGLTSQLRRAAISVITNIAEGWARRSARDKIRFLEIAQGSLLEVETESLVVLDLKFLTQDQFEKLNQQRSRVAFLLYRYKTKIEKHPRKPD